MARRRRRKKFKLINYFFLLLIVLILFILLIKPTRAKYRSSAVGSANVDLAYYLFGAGSISQDLKLESILPRDAAYEYTFLVANNDGTKRTDTAIDYSIIIKTTTNLPLEFEVYKTTDLTTDLAGTPNAYRDTDGTYFQTINVTGGSFGFSQNQQETYKILVKFPKRYNLAEYEGIVEYVQLTINSSQKITS